MEPWQISILTAYGVVVLAAFARHLVLSRLMPGIPFLTPSSPKMEETDAPLVSIMVPAKDEERGIEACLRSLLAQDYPNFEVLVVDDRSEDATPDIVRKLCAEDGRLRLVRIDHLPGGWTGKTHALHVCSSHAKGDWFLFVDADTRHHRSTLSVTLRDFLDHGVGMGSLMPALQAESFWERVIQPFAGICLMMFYPLTRVNDPQRKEAGFANGQFILVSRAGYEAIGGHEAVRDQFVEDIHLGRAARTAGIGLRVVVGRDLSSVRMYATMTEIVRGWSRILYSAVDHRPAKLYLLFLSICVFSVTSYAVLVGSGAVLLAGAGGPFASTLFLLGAAHQILQETLMARIYALSRSRLRYLAFRVLAVFVMLYIIVHTIRMCRTHQVQWRGDRYGKELRDAEREDARAPDEG